MKNLKKKYIIKIERINILVVFYKNMSKILVIVESPSKCKKVNEYLGSKYKVIASYGHFTKLNDLSQIDFKNYEIKYKIDNHKVLKTIKEELKKAKDIIIATDDDREGEAIGWMICKFCGLDIKKTKKIIFQEITEKAIKKSIENVSFINMNRVKSQQCRQILDIYLGYKISPLLWKYIANKLSAGRCQTPALKLIYDNQKEIDDMSLDTHYKISGSFTSNNINFTLNKHIDINTIDEFNEKTTLQDKYVLNSKSKKKTTHKQPKILITSSLQQIASNILKLSPKTTMKYAQELYENGYITYMRTDSSCYSLEFIKGLVDFIREKYGEEFVFKNTEKLSKSSNKNKTQDAHEGIRVTNLNTTEIKGSNKGVISLYNLIYKHTLQTGMSCAISEDSVYIIKHYQDYQFEYKNINYIFLGWMILDSKDKIKNYELFLDKLLNKEIKCNYVFCDEKIKSQKKHYSESMLIQKLEKMNIGRPSTFASIIDNLLTKGYVKKQNIIGKEIETTNYIIKNHNIEEKKEKILTINEKSKLNISDLGKNVCEFCYKYFNELFNYEFTNIMEEYLDNIERGDISNNIILDDYIKKINSLIEETKDKNIENINKKICNSLHCGKLDGHNPWIIKNGKYGYYLNIDKSNISLNEFKGFDIKNAIDNQIDLSVDKINVLKDYVKKSKDKKNETICIELSKECSIRKSKYGYYVYYKTKKMKQPKFMKFNEDCCMSWIEMKDIVNIKNYILKKYNINII
jgi:DNA topoisomerase-1